MKRLSKKIIQYLLLAPLLAPTVVLAGHLPSPGEIEREPLVEIQDGNTVIIVIVIIVVVAIILWFLLRKKK